MSSITRVEGWVSPGYLEQGPDAPRPNATLPAADMTVSTVLKPSVERMFSEFKIPGVYSDWKYVTYLRVETDMNNGADGIYYGWVDSIDLLSDSDTAPMVLVKWHIDLWRTYLYAADLRQGHIVRKPSGNHPLQGYDYIRRTATKKADILPQFETYTGRPCWWVYIAYNETVNAHVTNTMACWPVDTGRSQIWLGSGSDTKPAVPLMETLSGYWDEYLGIDPKTVTGCWISPTPPVAVSDISGTGRASDGLTMPPTISDGLWVPIDNGSYAWWYRLKTMGLYESTLPEIPGTVSASSTEVSQLAVVNFDGEVLQEIPVGATLSSYTYRTVLGPTEASIVIRFDGKLSRSEGLAVTVPLPTLDLSENAWSSYVYSGEREFEKDMRQMQSMQSGIQSIAGGAGQGAIFGGFGNMGAGWGALAGAAGGAITMATDAYVFNPQIQLMTDRYKQKQSAGILLSGSAGDSLTFGQVPCLISLDFDSYSASQASARDSQFGFSCSEFRSSIPLNTLTAGYWQIQGLNVQGQMPVEAKTYISRRFAAGVRLS